MKAPTYTLKEIAPILARIGPKADVVRINRQVRHWTIHGLLNPIERHTGRGRDRRYAFHEVRKAAIYLELARVGMTVGLLEGVGEWLDMLEDDNGLLWQFAKDRQFRVFIEVAWSPDETQSAAITVHPDDLGGARKAAHGKRGTTLLAAGVERMAKPRTVAEGMFSTIFINVTGLFEAIDG